MRQFSVLLLLSLVLTACGSRNEEVTEVIRGLKGFRVTNTTSTTVRRYPTVVRPATETELAFEVNGQLQEMDLEVGVQVQQDDILARVDPRSFELQVAQSSAARDEALSNFQISERDFNRIDQLFSEQLVSPSERDRSKTSMETAEAQYQQARRKLSLAEEDLENTILHAPFDGVIADVEVDNFVQVSPGQTILTLYSENIYEVTASVPATVSADITVGDLVNVFVPDLGDQLLAGQITELGSRAAQVSAFPLVVTISEAPDGLRAGMAAEIQLDIPTNQQGGGFLVPISAFAFDEAEPDETPGRQRERIAAVYVFDPTSSSVNVREVKVTGISENMVVVHGGLAEGEIVAAAGVSYLHDGQQVKLLPLDE